MTKEEIIRKAMRLLGQKTSERKKKTSRENVKKAHAARRKLFPKKI